MTQTVREWLAEGEEDLPINVRAETNVVKSCALVDVAGRPIFRLVIEYGAKGPYIEMDFLDEEIDLDMPIDEVLT